MANTDGVNVIITGDSQQLVRAVQKAQSALSTMKDRKIDIAVQLTGGLQEAGAKIESLFGSIFKTITAGAMSVAGALSMITKSALSIGGGFEAQITNVKVISGATEQELDMLIAKAREMGATLPITAKDAATAMQLLAQRGASAKDILASVSEVANLTISQGVDMASAAELLGSTMTNFGISVNDSSKITAIFNNACNQSALSMSKLIEAMKYVGPAAGAVDMNLTEAVAAMEAIANAGLTGEMTGTGFAMVLSKIASKSQFMSVQTKELDGSMRPLKDIFVDLKNAGFSLTDAIETFGQRGSKAALALAKNSESLERNEERLKNWGSTQAAVDAKARTFTNTMAAFRSAIEEFHIEIFEQIKDQSKEAIGGVTELARTFSKWVGETKIAGKVLNSFLDGLGFKIPSAANFKELLNQFNVQAFVDKVKNFGSTLRDIGESIASACDKIKTPLSWLIENLDTFATISFWGWILGKGLQIPAAILGIASSFMTLASSAKTLLGLSWANLTGLLASPLGLAGAAVAAGVAVAVYSANDMNAAREKLSKALDEERRFLSEQAKADLMLPVDIQLDFRTGFEKLPESWTKASDKVREEADKTIKDLQDKFKNKVSEAVLAVMAKFPEMADSFTDAAGTINQLSTSTLRQISNALHGDEKTFEAMPEYIRKVTEQINLMNMAADEGGMHLLSMFAKYQQVKNELGKPIKKDDAVAFVEELNAKIKSILTDLPAEIERNTKFLGGRDKNFAIETALDSARKKLDDFAKEAAKQYNISQELVAATITNSLESIGGQYRDAATSVMYGWKNLTLEFNSFMEDAQDAVKYLGESPEKFTPILEKLFFGLQKLDPLTGKLTKEFKEAYEALKQWSNITFDGLINRMSMLRKAYEGGFLRKENLIQQLKEAVPKIELQIVKDLYPQRELFGNKENFLAVVASEFSHKIADTFGDIGVKYLQERFGEAEGSIVGSWIISSVKEQLGVKKAPYGRSEKSDTDLADALKGLTQAISDARNVAPQHTDTSTQHTDASTQRTDTSTQRGEIDYSTSIAQVVTEIKTLFSGIQGVTDAVNSGVNALISTVVSVASPSASQGGNVSDTPNFQGVIDALTSNTSALEHVSENILSFINSGGSVNTDIVHSAVTPPENVNVQSFSGFQELSESIANAISSIQDNSSALSQTHEALIHLLNYQPDTHENERNNMYSGIRDYSAEFSQVISEIHSLSAGINALQPVISDNSTRADNLSASVKTQADNSQKIREALVSLTAAVNALQNAMKDITPSNNYEVNITQQGFMIQSKADADYVARSAFNAFSSGIGNGGV